MHTQKVTRSQADRQAGRHTEPLLLLDAIRMFASHSSGACVYLSILLAFCQQLMDIKGITEKKVAALVAAANKVSEFTFIVRQHSATHKHTPHLAPQLL